MFDITCPYCGKDFNYNRYNEYDSGELFSLDCPDCKKTMMVEYEMYPSFSAHQAPCQNGGEHEFKKVIGYPETAFRGKYKCKFCEEVKIDK